MRLSLGKLRRLIVEAYEEGDLPPEVQVVRDWARSKDPHQQAPTLSEEKWPEVIMEFARQHPSHEGRRIAQTAWQTISSADVVVFSNFAPHSDLKWLGMATDFAQIMYDRSGQYELPDALTEDEDGNLEDEIESIAGSENEAVVNALQVMKDVVQTGGSKALRANALSRMQACAAIQKYYGGAPDPTVKAVLALLESSVDHRTTCRMVFRLLVRFVLGDEEEGSSQDESVIAVIRRYGP